MFHVQTFKSFQQSLPVNSQVFPVSPDAACITSQSVLRPASMYYHTCFAVMLLSRAFRMHQDLPIGMLVATHSVELPSRA